MQTKTPAARPPAVFDRAAVRRNRARAAAGGDAAAFVHQRAADDVADRLETISRDFPQAAFLGARAGLLASALTPKCGVGTLIQADAAARMIEGARGPRLVAEEERLPFADQSLDLIVSFLTLHAANDLPGALAQIRRALKPDGLFIGVLFAGETLKELRASLRIAEAEISGGVAPRVAPFADLRDLGGLLQRARFALPVADADPVTVRYSDPARLYADLRAMGETSALAARSRKTPPRALFAAAAEVYKTSYTEEDGRVPATFELATLTGWAPHESQQKPLAPGSARASLKAAVLGERKKS